MIFILLQKYGKKKPASSASSPRDWTWVVIWLESETGRKLEDGFDYDNLLYLFPWFVLENDGFIRRIVQLHAVIWSWQQTACRSKSIILFDMPQGDYQFFYDVISSFIIRGLKRNMPTFY